MFHSAFSTMVLGLVLGLQGFGQDTGLECLEPESTPSYVFATVMMAFKQRKHLLYLHLKILLSFRHLKCSHLELTMKTQPLP